MWTDPQEIYDRVRNHLLNQKKPAMSGEGFCAYRGNEGTMCAIGCLMDDSFYSERYEGCGVKELPEEAISYLGGENMLGLLHDLQEVHDNHSYLKWKSQLRAVAEKHGLKP
jgi:hypothetical protein